MRQLVALTALVLGLAVTGVASAGGWATVGVDPLPTGVDAGETWRPEITILQHGKTPLTGLSPTLTIREQGGGGTRDFTAAETSEPGVYEASVVFPDAGGWNVVVESGFGDSRLTFGPVPIGGAPIADAPGAFPTVPVAVAGFALALLALFTFGIRRRWRPSPASH